MAITVKFGGVVLDSAENILSATNEILSLKEKSIVVVSASRGVTNRLETIATSALQGFAESELQINSLQEYHFDIARKLDILDECLQEFEFYKSKIVDIAKGLSIVGELSSRTLDLIVHYGERYSSKIIFTLLRKLATSANMQVCAYLSATDFLITDEQHRFAIPNIALTQERINDLLIPALAQNEIVVTEGYISKGANGQITTMGRESSDFSATLIAELTHCSEVRIYTNVAGVYTADPQVIPEAKKIDYISYSIAQEMAELGAKVLHPRTVAPIIRANIPLTITSIGQTGTVIHNHNKSRFYAVSMIPSATLLEIELKNAREKTDYIFEKIYKKVPILFSCRLRKRLKVACSLGLQEVNLEKELGQKVNKIIDGAIVSVLSTEEISPNELKNIFEIMEKANLMNFTIFHNNNSVSIFCATESAQNLALWLHDLLVK